MFGTFRQFNLKKDVLKLMGLIPIHGPLKENSTSPKDLVGRTSYSGSLKPPTLDTYEQVVGARKIQQR